MWLCYLRVLLGCESIGIIILPRVPLLAASERSSVEMLLDASSPSAPGTLQHSHTSTQEHLTFFIKLGKKKLKQRVVVFPTGTEYSSSCESERLQLDELIKTAR